MRLNLIFSIFLFFLFILSCSSIQKGRVVETESGALEAIGLAKNEPEARIAAVDQAGKFCTARKQKPIFRDEQLQSGSRRKPFGLDLKNVPVIGKVLKGEDTTQVILAFRCQV